MRPKRTISVALLVSVTATPMATPTKAMTPKGSSTRKICQISARARKHMELSAMLSTHLWVTMATAAVTTPALVSCSTMQTIALFIAYQLIQTRAVSWGPPPGGGGGGCRSVCHSTHQASIWSPPNSCCQESPYLQIAGCSRHS